PPGSSDDLGADSRDRDDAAHHRRLERRGDSRKTARRPVHREAPADSRLVVSGRFLEAAAEDEAPLVALSRALVLPRLAAVPDADRIPGRDAFRAEGS